MADSVNNASNATVAKPASAGCIWVGATTATAPTDASTAPGTAFTCLGHISEDGIKKNLTRDSETIKDMAGETVIVAQTEFEESYTFTPIEYLKEDVLELIYGSDNVSVDSTSEAITVTVKSDELPDRMFIIDTVMTGSKKHREVVLCGSVSELGEMTFKRDEAVGSEMTIIAKPVDGVHSKIYIA